MKDYIVLVTVGLHKFARQIAGVRPGRRRQRSLVCKLLLLSLLPMSTPLPLVVAVIVGVVFGVGVSVTIIVAIVIVTMVAMAMLIVAMPANMMVSTSAPDSGDLPRWRLRISVIFRRLEIDDGNLGDHIWFAMRTAVPRCHGLARRSCGDLDAVILLRRNYNVAPTSLILRLSMFLIASISIDATKME
jgi:hypothetical protein